MLFEGFRLRLKNHKPSTVLLASFFIVIVTGTLLLCLPFSHKSGVGFIDCLFAAVSASCVTGLLTITPLTDLTVFGKIVLLLMIQIGGLSLVSFIAVALKFRKEKLSFYEKKLLKDSLNKYDDRDVSGYLNSILIYTFVTEGIGFIILLTQFYDGSLYSVFESMFLSISAFCNAGIDISSTTSLLAYNSNAVVNITVTVLIILGGIGFIVWFDVIENIKNAIKDKSGIRIFYRRLKLHTKIVIMMTIALLASAFALILVFEYNGALAGMGIKDRMLAAWFNSATLRTAGFYSIDYSKLSEVTRIIMCVYMLIGGSPGGTAGGFKTTTLFLMLITAKSILKTKKNIHFRNRHIKEDNFVKAAVIIFLYAAFIFGGMIILALSEKLDTLDLLFEACSALGTVGLTVGITTELSLIGKIVIMIMMFIGRVGPTTLLLSMNVENKDNGITYPDTEIIVG